MHPLGTWFRTVFQFIKRWGRKGKEMKKASTRQDWNPWPVEFLLSRHVLNRCAVLPPLPPIFLLNAMKMFFPDRDSDRHCSWKLRCLWQPRTSGYLRPGRSSWHSFLHSIRSFSCRSPRRSRRFFQFISRQLSLIFRRKYQMFVALRGTCSRTRYLKSRKHLNIFEPMTVALLLPWSTAAQEPVA